MSLIIISMLIASLSGIYLLYRIISAESIFSRHHFKLFGAALLLYVLSKINLIYLDGLASLSDQVLFETIYEWIRISAVSLLLCAFGLMVRNSKPKISRAPGVLVFLPLLLIAAHPFVIDTLVVKDVLMQMYHGAAIIIGFLMFWIESKKNQGYIWLFFVNIIVLGAFLLQIFEFHWNPFYSSGVYLLVALSYLIASSAIKRIDLG